MTVFFHTLGCKLNQAETEALTAACLEAGLTLAGADQPADLVIINTCTVTGRSDAKARHAIRSLAAKHPPALVIVTGCYAEVEYDRLREHLAPENGAVVVPQSNKAVLLGLPAAIAGETRFSRFTREQKHHFFEEFRRQSTIKPAYDAFSLVARNFYFHSRAFLKIQDGCDGMCAYCRVPLARGQAVSLDFPRVADALARIVGEGFSEVVLTGVNISAYQSGTYDLAGLLAYAIRHTRHVRFRLSSLEPEALTPRFMDVLAEDAVCPHVHIPVQSGSDRVLGWMRRRYTVRRLTEGVMALRERKPGVFLSGDVIVGFPGETDRDFKASAALIEDLDLAHIHVFPFSPRPGTAAFSLAPRVPDRVIKERVRTLLQLSNMLNERYLAGWRGRTADVLLEKQVEPLVWTGSSAHSFKCRVQGIPAGSQRSGARVWAEIRAPGRTCRAVFQKEGGGSPRFVPHSEIEAVPG